MAYQCEKRILTHDTIFPELANVSLLCCDVDGVMTDGGLYYTDKGHTMVRFSVLDGLGLQRVRALGVKVCVISMSKTIAIQKRAEKLKLDYCFIGIEDKQTTIDKLLLELKLDYKNVAHIADDVNDLSLLEQVHYPVTVPNAVADVKEKCSYITKNEGGHGAVRDLCENIINAKLKN